jgi:hypothetical protein
VAAGKIPGFCEGDDLVSQILPETHYDQATQRAIDFPQLRPVMRAPLISFMPEFYRE